MLIESGHKLMGTMRMFPLGGGKRTSEEYGKWEACLLQMDDVCTDETLLLSGASVEVGGLQVT